jgi:hypothetical protein
MVQVTVPPSMSLAVPSDEVTVAESVTVVPTSAPVALSVVEACAMVMEWFPEVDALKFVLVGVNVAVIVNGPASVGVHSSVEDPSVSAASESTSVPSTKSFTVPALAV